MDRKRLCRRGLTIVRPGPSTRPLGVPIVCAPNFSGVPTHRLSGAQGVVQFSNQAFHTGLRIRGVALPFLFRLVKIIRNVQGGEDRDLRGVDRRRPFRNFFHSRIYETSQIMNVTALAIGADAVRLAENLYLSHTAPLVQIETLTPFRGESSSSRPRESTV